MPTDREVTIAELLAQVPSILKEAQLACELNSFDTDPDELLDFHDLLLRNLRDWMIEVEVARAL